MHFWFWLVPALAPASLGHVSGNDAVRIETAALLQSGTKCFLPSQVAKSPPLASLDLGALGLQLTARESLAAHEAQAIQVRRHFHPANHDRLYET